MGKRVISTALPEVMKFNEENNGIVKIAGSREDFASAIGKATSAPAGKEEAALAMKAAERNSWAGRVAEMTSLIESVEREKMEQKEESWKNNLARLYKKTRRGLAPAALAAALIYVLVFYTPLIWFAASPLALKDSPEKADVIIALGAGVGESGKAGQNDPLFILK